MRDSFAGTGKLVRLILRRDRFLLPLWILLPALLVVITASTFADLYPTAAAREGLAVTFSSPSLVALYGPTYNSSIGGLTTARAGAWPIIVALITLLTVIRHTRTDEEAGRRELVSATVVGRNATLAAALIVTVAGNLAAAAVTALGLIAQDMPVAGSIALGLMLATGGIVFAGVGAVAAQLSQTAGGARGISIGVLGLAFVARIIGDTRGVEAISWLSPFGWASRLRPYADEQWWVLLLVAAVFVLLTSAASVLSSRRDLGGGVLPERVGRPSASPALRTSTALAWRLQRPTLLGWIIGAGLYGVVLGGVAAAAVDFLKEAPELQIYFGQVGGAKGLADVFLATILGLLAMIASAYAVQAALKLRSEEESMRAEQLLATSVPRWRWMASHVAFALLGPAVVLAANGLITGVSYGATTGDMAREIPRVLGAAMVRLPAVWVIVGIAVALFGLLPRLARATYGLVLAIFLLAWLGPLFDLPEWVLDLSPFTHVPALPGGEFDLMPLVWLSAIAVVLIAVGFVGFRRRDTPA